VAWASLAVATAALVSSKGLTRAVPAAPSMPVESQKTARALSDAFVSVAEYVKPSVVQIGVERKGGNIFRLPNSPGRRNPFQRPPGNNNGPNNSPNIPKELPDLLRELMKQFGNPDFNFEHQQFSIPGQGTGSGFVFDDRGHVLTNNHVVSGAGKITVTFHDGVEANATVVGTDPKSDVAVLKVDNTSYPPLARRSSGKLRVGELVMAVGSPFGLSQTVTMGIVSATDRNNLGINDEQDSFESFIQTDAPINPGNSGGPLVDLDGRVVGINSAIVSGGRGNDGVGFAIPIDMASNIADSLVKNGKVNRARIGVRIQPLAPAMARGLGIDPKTKGIIVGEVVPGSPADKAGLKAGDVITGFNNQPVSNSAAFKFTVSASEIGKPYRLKYFRDGKEHTTDVVLSAAEKVVFDAEEESATASAPARASEKESVKDFGLEVQPLTPELAKGLGLSEAKGLLVSSVKEGSPAEAARLQPGDVITQVVRDRKIEPVKDVKDFQDLAGKSDELNVFVKSSKGPGGFITLSKAK